MSHRLFVGSDKVYQAASHKQLASEVVRDLLENVSKGELHDIIDTVEPKKVAFNLYIRPETQEVKVFPAPSLESAHGAASKDDVYDIVGIYIGTRELPLAKFKALLDLPFVRSVGSYDY